MRMCRCTTSALECFQASCTVWPAGSALMKGDSDVEAGGFEIAKLCDWLGLNHWEMFEGMNWFIQNCCNAVRLLPLMGQKLSLNKNGPAVYPKAESEAYLGFTPEQAVQFIQAIAYRNGDGDIFCRGNPTGRRKTGIARSGVADAQAWLRPPLGRTVYALRPLSMWVISAGVSGHARSRPDELDTRRRAELPPRRKGMDGRRTWWEITRLSYGCLTPWSGHPLVA